MSKGSSARRVGVDLTPMEMGGVNGGTKLAAQGLIRLIAASGRFKLSVFIKASYSEELLFSEDEHVDIVRVDDRFLLSQERMFGGKEPWSLARAVGCDLLFAPFGDPLLWEPDLPTVTQRYDLQHLDHPEFFDREELRHRGHSDRRLKELSTHFITSSEFSRATFISKLGLEPERLSVIPLPLPAVPGQERTPKQSSILVDLGLKDLTYLYYPANFWPHKNHLRLLDAFASATSHIDSDAPHLVLTGDTLDAAEEIRARAETCRIADRFHILGFVSDEERDAIWRGCEALIFPSLYEGFGIPMQEAMLYDKPIVASDACSIPEVGGPAAAYFDGRDIDDMARSIRSILEERDTREEQARHREDQLQKFEPGTIAAKYIEIFDHVLAGSETRPHPEPARIDIAITGCETPVRVEYTLASIESQGITPRNIILVSTTHIDAVTRHRASRIAPLSTVVADDEHERAIGLDTALRACDGDALVFLEAGDTLLAGALRHAASAVAEFPNAWLVHGLTLDIARNGAVVRERPIEPIERSNKSSRRFAARSSSLISRRSLDSTAPLDTTRFACEALIAQVSDDTDSLHFPVYLSQTPLESNRNIRDLKILDDVLRARAMPDSGAWIIDECEAIIVADAMAEGTTRTQFQITDQLLWAAPFLYALAGVPFDDSSLRALKSKWRRARAGPEASLLMNPLQSILAANPRDTVLRGLVGPPVHQRAAKTFAEPDLWKRIRSVSAFRRALYDASADDLQPEWRELLTLGNTREFVVSTFELAAKRTPCAAEVELFADANDDVSRLSALKNIISAATARDWDDIMKAALERTPFHVTSAPETVFPIGSDIPSTADEWFARREAARTRIAAEPALSVPASAATVRERSETDLDVTILCSLYNGDEYIEPYLQNITAQKDFSDCELVIIDACSPGQERAVIERYVTDYPNISYTRAASRIGIYEAWNLGIHNSTGRFITNANLDDARQPESIVRMREALDAHSKVDVVYSDCFYTFLPHLPWNEIEGAGLRSHLPPPSVHNMLDFNSPHCAPMWRRSLHDRFGYFDENFKSAGDWEFWLRCIRGGLTLHKVEPPVVAYFHNPRGMSTQRNTPSALEEAAIRRTYRDLLIGPNAALDPIATTDDTYGDSSPRSD